MKLSGWNFASPVVFSLLTLAGRRIICVDIQKKYHMIQICARGADIVDQPKDDIDVLRRVYAYSWLNFCLIPRKDEPEKDPFTTLLKLQKSPKEGIETIIKHLTHTDFQDRRSNHSPGHTADVWIFKKAVTYETKEGIIETMMLYIKMTFEHENQITVISFHP